MPGPYPIRMRTVPVLLLLLASVFQPLAAASRGCGRAGAEPASAPVLAIGGTQHTATLAAGADADHRHGELPADAGVTISCATAAAPSQGRVSPAPDVVRDPGLEPFLTPTSTRFPPDYRPPRPS